jgi:hypothetical protein
MDKKTGVCYLLLAGYDAVGRKMQMDAKEEKK